MYEKHILYTQYLVRLIIFYLQLSNIEPNISTPGIKGYSPFRILTSENTASMIRYHSKYLH